MSDKTTGEWKHVFLDKISLSSRIEVGENVIARNLGRENAERIVNDHNAALAAERAKREAAETLARIINEQADREETQLRQQLAAEREVSLRLVKNVQHCEKQLAAEREKQIICPHCGWEFVIT